MKILHIYRETTNGEIGGVQYHVKYLSQAQSDLGYNTCVLIFKMSQKDNLTIESRDGVLWYFLDIKDSFYRAANQLRWLHKGKMEFIFIAMSRIRQNSKISKKLKLIEEIAPDIIHQHDYLSSVRLSKKASLRFNVVFTNHYGEYLLLKKTRISRYWQNTFLNNFKSVIAPSHNLLPDKNSFYIPNGVNLEVFPKVDIAQKSTFKSNLNLEDKVVFLCPRRWAPNKGVLYLVEALNMLSHEIKQNAVFLFAGNNEEDFPVYQKKVMGELLKSTDLNYRLLGNLNHTQLSQIINASDIGIIPSLVEGMSLSSIEMISCGIPVLATNVGGLPEIIKPHENGWLVPSKNAKALADEISRIVMHWPESNLNIETLAFREKYSWRKIAVQTLEIYHKILF